MRIKGRRMNTWMPLDEQRIREAHALGVPSTRIAVELGVCHTTIDNRLRKLGLQPRKPGRPRKVTV